jgi:hypothetical protein
VAMLARPIRHLGLGHYKTWFLLILEDLALVVRPELAVPDGKCNSINSPVPTEPGLTVTSFLTQPELVMVRAAGLTRYSTFSRASPQKVRVV